VKKSDAVQHFFKSRTVYPQKEKGIAYAPTNIALCKYWGKRNAELNLPVTSSLSIALPDKGTMTTLSVAATSQDNIILNGLPIANDSSFLKRTSAYLDLFRPSKDWYLNIDININIPIAAGLASSASGFASLVSALNDLFDWRLPKRDLSILARIGSGSACRSLWNGFVEWHAGVQEDGMDSFGEPLAFEWPSLRVGILTFSERPKPISSRDAMQTTVNTSTLYASWPDKVRHNMSLLKQALQTKDFELLGATAESNALSMHATMLDSWPPICYFLPETIAAMQQIWQLRSEGLALYFTQDAGPNLKLLFLAKDQETVLKHFPDLSVVDVFESVE
jgi:diphosphomevalonate decarboxylase